MEGAKEYFLRLREEELFDLPQHLRMKVVVHYNDYQLYKDDPQFKGLYSRYRKAKDEMETFKFKRRHNITK
jgi:hypothetical protein